MYLALRWREENGEGNFRLPGPVEGTVQLEWSAAAVGTVPLEWSATSIVSGWAQLSGSWSRGAELCLHYRVLGHFVTASQKVIIFLESVRNKWRGDNGLAEPPPRCWHSSWVWNAKTQTECSQFLRMCRAIPGQPHLTSTAVANKKSPGWHFPSPWPGG